MQLLMQLQSGSKPFHIIAAARRISLSLSKNPVIPRNADLSFLMEKERTIKVSNSFGILAHLGLK